MGNFDMTSYLEKRLDGVGTSKMDALLKASAEKTAALGKLREKITYEEANPTLRSSMGLSEDSTSGFLANVAASAYSGTSRMVGNVVGIPEALSSAIDTNTATEGSVDARNRLKQGLATAADMALLNDKRYVPDANDTPEVQALGAKQVAASKTLTNLELLDRAAKSTQVSRNINDAFDRSSLVDQGNREALSQHLKAGFGDAWNEFKTGGKQMYDAMGTPYGDGMVEGAGNALAGMARLIYNAGDAAISNPKGVIEYAAENAPQLLMGLAGKAGSIAQGATNVGYAVDNFQQGMQNYAAKNNGQMPSDAERSKMAFEAASLALAEQVGDHIGTAAITKGVKTGVAAEKTGLRETLKNMLTRTGNAALEGAASEVPTEGYQTYMEGQITGKPVSAADIYEGSVIGGLSGAALSGGGHGVHEVVSRALGTSEDQVLARQQAQSAKAEFNKAVVANDPSVFLDSNSSLYSPTKGVGVLLRHAQLESTSPEVKQANLDKASQILGDLETQQATDKSNLKVAAALTKDDVAANEQNIVAIKAAIATIDPAETDKIATLTNGMKDLESQNALADPKARKIKEAELTRTAREIATTKGTQQEFARRMQMDPTAAVTPETVKASVATADAVVDTNDTAAVAASNAAVEHLITLSMKDTSHLTVEDAHQLATNTKNSLTVEQRSYMRAFSDARVAENQAKSPSEVNKDVVLGGKGYTGIAQYRADITHAMNYSSPSVVQDHLAGLVSFAQIHAAKLAAASKAFAEVTKKGSGVVQLVMTENGWEKPAHFLSDKALAKNGGMSISSGSTGYVHNIQNESIAINASVKEMKAAIALKQSPSVATAPTATPSVQSAPTPTIVTPIVTQKESTNVTQAPETVQTESQGSQASESSTTSTGVAESTTAASVGAAEVQPATVIEATQEQKDAEKAHKEATKALKRLKRKNPFSLWTALKHTMSASDLMDVYGSEWKKRYTMLKGNPGSSITTAIANGMLDEFLPHNMRFGTGIEHAIDSGVEQQAEEHIKDLLRERNYLTEDTKLQMAQIGLSLQELEETLSLKDIQDAIAELTASESTVDQADTATETQDTAQTESVGNTDGVVAKEDAAQVTEPVESTGLNVLNQPKSAEGTEFRKRQLITDFFTQTKSKITDLTSRPLTSVKGFLTALVKGDVKTEDFLPPDVELTGEQVKVVNLFKRLAAEWQKAYQPALNHKANESFRYEDMMQFLMEETGKGKWDVEENIKTAMSISAFLWVAENAGKSQWNTPEEINLILQRDEDTEVTDAEFNALGQVGIRENVIRNALGQKAVAALGLKLSKGASKDMMARLESALGAHIEKMMIEQGLMTRTTKTGTEMRSLTGNSDTSLDAKFYFLKAARQDGEMTADNKEIFEANKNTSGVLNKLFDVQSDMKYPSFEPIKFTQKTTKNTKQLVPKILARILNAKNAEANYIRQDMWKLLSKIDAPYALEMAGVENVTSENTHAANRNSLDAKNDGLTREYDNFMEFVGGMEDTTSALYFEHSAWKQQRVGIATNMINPQTSKIHRFMLYRQEWETKVDINSPEQLINFKLRVAEGLGVKTDKNSTLKALSEFNIKMQAPETKRAVALLRKANKGDTLTETEQQQLSDAVKWGGSKFHSLDAFMALAHYAEAKANKETSFTVHMMGEIDGVTNGPMLSHLLLGAASSAGSLFGLLNKGGFYELGNQHSQYNDWRSSGGKTDLYETTALHMVQSIKDYLVTKPKLSGTVVSIEFFTGTLENNGVIEKAGRDIVKKPLTAMLFGSSIPKAIDGMADKFIESVYGKIEDLKEDSDAEALIKHLNIVMWGDNRLNPKMTRAQLMEHTFTPDQIEGLKKAFKVTIGTAVKATMEQDFGDFISIRTTTTNTSNLAFELYKSAYDGIRAEYIKELAANGEITLTDKGMPIQSLTPAQEETLQQKLEVVVPVMHTMLSKESGQLDAGLYLAKTTRQMSDDAAYQGKMSFGNGFADNGVKTATTRGVEVVETNPGVAALIMAIHSTDSAISHLAADGNEVLNIHDAHGSGLGGFQKTAQNLNHATWTAMLSYSPTAEMFDALARTVAGFAQLAQNKDTPKSVLTNLLKALDVRAEKDETSSSEVLRNTLQQAKITAFNSDKIKYEALVQMAFIDQYALAGGNYMVTDADRTAAQTKLDALIEEGSDLSAEVEANLAIIEKALGFGNVEVTTKSEVAELGQSNIKSDPELVTMFEAKSEMTGKGLLVKVKEMLSKAEQTPETQAQLLLLPRIFAALSPNLTIKYVTADTKLDEVLAKGESGSRGWYVSNKNKDAIYVLSDAFKHSGLTTELLVHELYHAALARVMKQELDALKANPSYKSDALSLVQELQTLQSKAADYVKDNNLGSQFDSALSSVDEFVSWGMTNQAFRDQVISKLSIKSSNKGNPLINGMKSFIQSIVGLIVKEKSNQAIAENGLTILTSNVAGLLSQAAQVQGTGDINLSMATQTTPSMYTTNQLFEALADPVTSLPAGFTEHLQGLLNGIVTKLHGPFGSFKDMMGPNVPMTQEQTFQKAIATGIAPFASHALAAHIGLNDQTAFVLEQVEATMRAALNTKHGEIYGVTVLLRKLFVEQSKRLTAKDFEINNRTTAEAQDFYDFIFKIDAQKGNKEDHLARFAALGLVHPHLNSLLQVATEKTKNQSDGSPAGALKAMFFRILDWFSGKLTHTENGMRADTKLKALVEQLVYIENKRKERMEDANKGILAPLEEKAQGISNAARDMIAKGTRLPIFANSKSNIVKLAATMTRITASGRVLVVTEALRRLSDEHFAGVHGVAVGLVDNLLGPDAGSQVLLRNTKKIEQERKFIADQVSRVVRESFENGGADLTDEQKGALTSTLIHTGAHILLDQAYSLAQIENLMRDKVALQKEINHFEQELLAFPTDVKDYFLNQSRTLAYYLATNKVAGEHLMMNAENIALMHSTGQQNRLSDAQTNKAVEIIDALVTLQALAYTSQTAKDHTAEIMRSEAARTEGNGAEMILLQHKELERDARERVFNNNEALMIKGYVPDIYNPYTAITSAGLVEGADLINRGYSRGLQLALDPRDPNREERHIYVLRDGGKQGWLSGVFSLTSMKAKGSTQYIDNKERAAFNAQKSVAINALFRPNPGFDPSKVNRTFMAPILNSEGDITDYHYLMTAHTKNELLERNLSFDKLLGTLAGNTFDKESSAVQNKKAVSALYEQYKADYASNPTGYVLVGAKSPDPEIREMFRMLPYETRMEIEKIWGRDGMQVQKSLMDVFFGYRRQSLSTLFDNVDNNIAARAFTTSVEFAHYAYARYKKHLPETAAKDYAKRSAITVARSEHVMQEIVKVIKSNYVIRSMSTMTGNIISNETLLFLHGVPIIEGKKQMYIAYTSALAYGKDSARLFELKNQIATGISGMRTDQIEQEIAQLEDAIARNPVKPLIDAGLMPTIVEDMSQEEDPFSYKSGLLKKTDKWVNQINPHIRTVAKNVFMTQDTAGYKAMSHVTQLSDFVARYALFQHLTTRKTDVMTHEAAIQEASESFINYDLPMQRKLQYTDDMGLTMFTKYFLGIQRVIFKRTREAPGRALMLLMATHFLGLTNTVLHSSFIHHAGRMPLHLGVAQYFSSHASIVPIKFGSNLINP